MPTVDFISAFSASLHLEHLEEASFFYEYRREYLAHPERDWRGIKHFEDRLERHVEALHLDAAAVDVCVERAASGDFGELHAALRVFCRHDEPEHLVAALQARVVDDDDCATAAADALCHESPGPWLKPVMQALVKGGGRLVSMASRLAGYQRLPVQKWLQRDFETPEEAIAAQWALGRLRVSDAEPVLLQRLRHEDERVRSAAAHALLALGSRQVVPDCLALAEEGGWPLVPLGLGGGPRTAGKLLQRMGLGAPSPELITSLGLLGDAAAVEPLLAALGDKGLAESAATALWLITGAELFEQVMIPEPDDDVDDGADPGAGQARGSSRVEPPGETVTRVSRDPESWRSWWQQNSARFEPTVRYRCGQASAPASLFELLSSSSRPRRLRQLAYEELVVRYGLDLFFDTELSVSRQEDFLHRCQAWLQANSHRYRPGAWYYAGQTLAS